LQTQSNRHISSMSYQQPPPGLRSTSNTPQPHPSLPARPPPGSSSSKPAFPSAAPPNGPSRGGGAFVAFKPRNVASNPTWSAPPAPPSSFTSQTSAYPSAGYGQQQQQQAYQYPQQQAQQPYYTQPATAANPYAPTPPTIHNPFPLPGQEQGGAPIYDPEYEAQIAQWQSTYATPLDSTKTAGAGAAGGANAIALGSRPDASTPIPATPTEPFDPSKKKTVVRSGGGESWSDDSLLEWDPAHFRLFVGNLAGEVTDESLLKAFAKYPSVQKARVIREKRTTKSKGFGFVSFSDGDQFFLAAKEMDRKYIGSHPVTLRRAVTDVRSTVLKDNKRGRGGKGGGGGRGGGGGGGRDAAGGADTGAGVHKKLPKTKGGLKLLG